MTRSASTAPLALVPALATAPRDAFGYFRALKPRLGTQPRPSRLAEWFDFAGPAPADSDLTYGLGRLRYNGRLKIGPVDVHCGPTLVKVWFVAPEPMYSEYAALVATWLSAALRDNGKVEKNGTGSAWWDLTSGTGLAKTYDAARALKLALAAEASRPRCRVCRSFDVSQTVYPGASADWPAAVVYECRTPQCASAWVKNPGSYPAPLAAVRTA